MIKVAAGLLAEALSAVAPAVDKKASIPLLVNVLLEPRKGTLSLRGSDSFLAASASVVCESEPAAPFAVDMDRLKSMVSSFSKTEMVSLVLKDDKLEVKCKGSRYSLVMLPGAEYPPYPKITKSAERASIAGDTLRQALDSVAHAHGKDVTRGHLCGVHFNARGDGSIETLATDAMRLSQASVPYPEGSAPLNVFISTRASEALSAMAAEAGENNVELAVSASYLFFWIDGIGYAAKRVESPMIDAKRIFGKSGAQSTCVVSRTSFIESVKRLTILDVVDIDIDFNKKMEVFVASAFAGNGREDVATESFAGTRQTIRVNARYVLDVANASHAESLELKMWSLKDALIIRDHGEAPVLWAGVMPVEPK